MDPVGLSWPEYYHLKDPEELCDIGYPPKTHLKLIYREILFAHDLFISHPIVLMDAMDEQGFCEIWA